MIYCVRVAIFENENYPVVVHEFYGKTPEEAHHYHEAHRKTDSFLRSCEDSEHWRDVACRAYLTEGWVKKVK